MKMIIVALAFVALASAATVPGLVENEVPKILRSDYEQKPEGGYNFAFETENGITREETGDVKDVLDEENKPHTVVVVRGSYSYLNTEGKPETISYVADENGFQPQGDSIPKPVSRR